MNALDREIPTPPTVPDVIPSARCVGGFGNALYWIGLTDATGYQLYRRVASAPEGAADQLTSEPRGLSLGWCQPAQLSPKGNWLTLVRDAGGGKEDMQLCVAPADAVPVDGSLPWQAISPPGRTYGYCWNADETSCVFGHCPPGEDRYAVYEWNQDRGTTEIIPGWTPGYHDAFCWGPDGILVLTEEGSERYQLNLIRQTGGSWIREPVFRCESGMRLSGPILYLDDCYHLLTSVDADTLGPTKLVRERGQVRLRRLTSVGEREVETHACSADGDWYVLAYNQHGASRVVLWDLRRRRSHDLSEILPLGYATEFQFNPECQRLFFTFWPAEESQRVMEVSLGEEPAVRTAFAYPLPDGLSVPACRHVRTVSADGLMVTTFLYLPNAPTPVGGWPLIVQMHGGPAAQDRPLACMRKVLACTSRGVAVAEVNYRGGTGDGDRFRRAASGRQRTMAVVDVYRAIRALRQFSEINPDHITVFGASYGGYLTLAVLTMAGLDENPHWAGLGIRNPKDVGIRGGVACSAITDFPASFEGMDPSRRRHRAAEYGDPDDPAMAEYLKNISPISRAERVWDVVIVHGEQDSRVPIGQALAFARRVEAAGGTVRIEAYPAEGHVFGIPAYNQVLETLVGYALSR